MRGRIRKTIFNCIVIAVATCLVACSTDNPIPKVILDTDISSDVDDVGAVAVLHSLEKQGDVEILGMVVSSGDQWSAPCLKALNAWFGKPQLPVGVAPEGAVVHLSKYTRRITEEYLSGPKHYSFPDSVSLYRQLLAAQPDNSVTVITVGYLTNLELLLRSQPDEHSLLDGVALVKKKVKELVCMGGQYPNGREWNFYQDAKAAQYVVKKWPSSIVFCGYELGVSILTGEQLKSVDNRDPVRQSYLLYNELKDRPSWDQIAVLYGVFSDQRRKKYWSTKSGHNNVLDDGSNTWENMSRTPFHNYVIQDVENQILIDLVHKLMIPPDN